MIYLKLQLICFFEIFCTVICLYEDQIGKFDWSQKYIGHVENWFLESLSGNIHNRQIHVVTRKNVVGSLNLANGAIVWRKVLEEDGQLIQMQVSDSNIFTVSFLRDITVNCWDTLSGNLNWSEDFQTSSLNSLTAELARSQFDFLIIPNKKLIVLIYADRVWTLALNDGSLRWTHTLKTSCLECRVILQPAMNSWFLLQITPSLHPQANNNLNIYELSETGENVNLRVVLDFPSSIESIRKSCCFVNGHLICVSKNLDYLYDTDIPEKDSNRSSQWVAHSLKFLTPNGNSPILESVKLLGSESILLKAFDQAFVLSFTASKEGNLNIVKQAQFTQAAFISTTRDQSGKLYILMHKIYTEGFSHHLRVEFHNLLGQEISGLSKVFRIPSHNGRPLKAIYHMFHAKSGQASYRMILQTEDSALHCFGLTKAGSIWVREESLAGVIAADMVDPPVSENQAKMEEEFGNQDGNLLEMFIKRIITQASQLKGAIFSYVRSSGLRAYKRQEDLLSESEYDKDELTEAVHKDLQSEGEESLSEELTRDEFNLHKIIVCLCSSGKMFGIDSQTGHILWRYFMPNVRPYSLGRGLLYQQRTNSHFPLAPQFFVSMQHKISDNSVVLLINPINGIPNHWPDVLVEGYNSSTPYEKELSFGLLQATMVLHSNRDDHLRPVIFLDKKEIVHVFPSDYQLSMQTQPVYLFTASHAENSSQSQLSGYRLINLNSGGLAAINVWSMKLGSSDTRIAALARRSSLEHVHSVGRILGDRGVLYKYLNPNLLVIITESVADSADLKNVLILYVIDVVVGKVVYSTHHRRCGSPVSLVHSENWIVYSFYNQKSLRFEVAVLELYENNSTFHLSNVNEMESDSRRSVASQHSSTSFQSTSSSTSLYQIVKNFCQSSLSLFGKFTSFWQQTDEYKSKVFSSQQRSSMELVPHVLRQAYIIASPINNLAVSLTDKGITAKSVLLALVTGGVLEIPKSILDPRRSLDLTQELREEGVEAYIPELPLSTQNIINYNQSLQSISGILTHPSGLESTSLVFVFGLDLFFTRVAPSKMYDVLKEDFDYTLIALVTFGMIFGSVVTRHLAAQKALKRAWH